MGFHQKAMQAKHSIQRTQWSRRRMCASSCPSTMRRSPRWKLLMTRSGSTTWVRPPIHQAKGEIMALELKTSGVRRRPKRLASSSAKRCTGSGAACDARERSRAKRTTRLSDHAATSKLPSAQSASDRAADRQQAFLPGLHRGHVPKRAGAGRAKIVGREHRASRRSRTRSGAG